MPRVERALISVTDKRGVTALGRGLTIEEDAQIDDITETFGTNDTIDFDATLAGGTITLGVAAGGAVLVEFEELEGLPIGVVVQLLLEQATVGSDFTDQAAQGFLRGQGSQQDPGSDAECRDPARPCPSRLLCKTAAS